MKKSLKRWKSVKGNARKLWSYARHAAEELTRQAKLELEDLFDEEAIQPPKHRTG